MGAVGVGLGIIELEDVPDSLEHLDFEFAG